MYQRRTGSPCGNTKILSGRKDLLCLSSTQADQFEYSPLLPLANSIDTNEPDMNQSNQTESEETQNDEVVGSAIKLSLGIFLVFVAAGILIWLLT